MSDWIVRLIEQSGYLGVGFLMFLETVFPPIPSEVIMSVAGVAAGQGKLNYGLVVAAGTAGDKVARSDAPIADAPIDGRPQFGEIQIQFGLTHRRLVGAH